MLITDMTTYTKSLLVSFTALALLVTPVFAVGSSARPSTVPVGSGSGRLNEAKIKVCQVHEEVINTRASNLNRLVTNMLSKFDAIAVRVEEYYTGSGLNVAGYGTLVSTIAAKKSAVESALLTAENDANSFSCTGENPKGKMTEYRKDMQAVISGLKEYRSSIKDLIVAVRRASGDEQKVSPNPKPSMSPNPHPSNPGKGNK